MKPWQWLLVALAVAGLCMLLPIATAPKVVLAITAFSMVLWISEWLPLAITGLLSSLLLIAVAGRDAGDVFGAYFDPIIVLLLGGFFLGVALTKVGLDARLAAWAMQHAHGHPARMLLMMMLTTAAFSMWLSNTAATAIMLPIALGVVTAREGSPNLAKALVLGVAFSANVGGIGTPIGTTPNPIALRFLADAGEPISFLGWMVRAVPLVLAMVVLVWAVLLRVFPLRDADLSAPATVPPAGTGQRRVIAIFALTVLLWLTTDLHGQSAALVSVLAIVLLFATGVLGGNDIHKAGWPTVLLIGAGLALGDSVTATGLDGIFADQIQRLGAGGWVAYVVVAAAAVVMTLLASNTAAAVIMIPIVMQLAVGWGLPLQGVTMLAAAALSLDFLVPVGTPPNAMAHGTGHVRVADMLKAGSWLSVGGIVIAATLAWWFW